MVLDQGSRSLSFHRKSGFPVGFSDTIWYGGDHFNYCHRIEGLRAIVHYQKPRDATYAETSPNWSCVMILLSR